mmetsp:Transcript_93626/g.291798  ORF Transcript_93626/g.291798 Transcript_93626/m.291798 type:complete len:310 (-) Transcript_93626:16-945(-)
MGARAGDVHAIRLHHLRHRLARGHRDHVLHGHHQVLPVHPVAVLEDRPPSDGDRDVVRVGVAERQPQGEAPAQCSLDRHLAGGDRLVQAGAVPGRWRRRLRESSQAEGEHLLQGVAAGQLAAEAEIGEVRHELAAGEAAVVHGPVVLLPGGVGEGPEALLLQRPRRLPLLALAPDLPHDLLARLEARPHHEAEEAVALQDVVEGLLESLGQGPSAKTCLHHVGRSGRGLRFSLVKIRLLLLLHRAAPLLEHAAPLLRERVALVRVQGPRGAILASEEPAAAAVVRDASLRAPRIGSLEVALAEVLSQLG